MKKITFILALLLVFAACSPISNNQEAPTSITNMVPVEDHEQEKIDEALKPSFLAFADAFIHEQIVQSPLNASFTYGDLEAEGLGYLMYELDDASMESSYEALEDLREAQRTLYTYDYIGLTREEKRVYELLDYQLDVAIRGEDYLLYYNNFNPSFGLHVIMPLTLSQLELETPSEVDAYMSRISKLPQTMAQAIEVEKLKAEASLLLPAELYEATIEQINEMIADGPENFMLYLSFVDRIEHVDFLSEDQKVTYKKACLATVRDSILPAYEEMASALNRIKAFDTNTLGTREWADHKDYYEWLIYKYTSYDLSTRELRSWLTSELTITERELEVIINGYPDLFDALEVISEFEIESIEEAYKASERIYEEHFEDYGVYLADEEVIPDYLVDHLPGGFYFPTSIDWQDYGTMFMPVESYSNLDIDTFTTLLHENVPGHHMYYSVLYNSDVPFVQKMSDWDPYSEGWAVYVQQYAFEILGMEDEALEYIETYLRYVYLKEMLRDMHVHLDGVSKDEVVGELMASGSSEESAEKNYNRMLANPGEVFQYYYSFMKIDSYRERYEDSYKNNFDEEAFHDLILRNINMPFTSMDQLINEALADN